MTKCAFLDFDDTLCRGDSVVPFLLYAVRKGVAPWWQVPKAIFGYLIQLGRPGKTRRAKEITFSFIKGKTTAEMDSLARGFFQDVVLPRLFPEAMSTLLRLRGEGYTILVVSASADVYMRVLPEFLPVDAVLSTTCQVQDGRYTGAIGPNCKGEEKPLRIAAWLKDHGLTLDASASCAYGDSPSDGPMLRLVASPMLVSPHRKLAAQFPDAPICRWR